MSREVPARGRIAAAVEIHTPCSRDDRPLPALCRYGHFAETAIGNLRGRCRVAHVRLGEQLFFGSQQPEGQPRWLQVGPNEPLATSAGRLISGVTGQFWVTSASGGGRVMVENLSKSVTIEIRSERLPENPKLYPVDIDEPARERWLGTAIVALQTPTAQLVLRNQGQEFLMWAILTTDRWDRALPPAGTANVRDHAGVDIDEAAMRIELGSPDHLDILRAFVDDRVVRERLRGSTTLSAFLASKGNHTHTADPDDFCERQLQRVAEGKATHELHRLILEGLGRPPVHASKHYTDTVRNLIEPQRERGSIRGGSGGLSELVGPVRAHFRFRPGQLANYLGVGRDIDRGPERGPDVTPG